MTKTFFVAGLTLGLAGTFLVILPATPSFAQVNGGNGTADPFSGGGGGGGGSFGGGTGGLGAVGAGNGGNGVGGNATGNGGGGAGVGGGGGGFFSANGPNDGAPGSGAIGALTNTGIIQGGAGALDNLGDGGGGGGAGIGGGGGDPGGGGGAGGAGGFTITNSTITNTGTISGGAGGNSSNYGGGGGGAGIGNGGAGADSGGAGGAGLNGLIIINSGTIQGGNGGAGASGKPAGAGGAGIAGSGMTITNSGTISGGLNGGGGTRANAVTFTGGSNTLTLQTGSVITGNIAIDAGTLTFNQGTAQTLSNIVTGAGGVINNSTGPLTLSGANTYAGGTTVQGGTLQLSGAGTLGAATGSLAVSGGTLDLGATSQATGALTLTGGTIQNGTLSSSSFAVQAGTISAVLAGGGALTKTGAGSVTLSGANTYAGATNVNDGTLLAGATNTFSATSAMSVATGGILNLGGFAQTINAVALTGGTLTNGSLTGAVTSTGGTIDTLGGAASVTTTAGLTTVIGTNTYTGSTMVNAGTLAIAATGSITSNVTNAATFTNSGTATGNLINSGTARNDLTITGTVSNAGIFNNTAAGTVIGTLTNTAGTTTNTGGITGGVMVSGGTLTTTGTINGGLTNAAVVNANGGAINGAVANNGGTFNAGGTVTSDSAFDNASGATLAVAGTGNYTIGGLLTNAGAVTVASGGTLVATAGGIANMSTGTIINTGTIRDDLNNAGAVTNNGAYIANVATNTGSIANNNSWTGNINTGGTFTNAGIVTGTLTNTAGITTNDGSISGAVTVSGGTFKGTGSSGGLTIGNGAVFAPGNGTPGDSAAVNGSLAFSSGAFYQVAINPQTASFTNVTGAATLGGASVQALFSSGSYVNKQYTIVNATGGVTGTFAALASTNLPSGFNATLSTDATHAYLNLALNFAPPPSGLNVNQNNVGNAVVDFFNSTGSIPIVFGALTPTGLTQVAGETATGTLQTTFNAMNMFMGVMTDPFMTGRGNGISGGGNATSYADEAALGYANGRRANDALAAIHTKARPMVPAFEQRWSTWIAGYGGSQSTDGNTALGSNNTTSSVYGTAVGADYRFSPDTIAGFSLAGGGTRFSVANSGSGRSDLFQAGAFIRHTAGSAYISAALAYGWQDITSDRTVTVAGVDRLRAEFNVNAWSGRLEGGYRFVVPAVGGGLGITPYAAGQFTTFDLPAYAERVLSGAGAFALAYGAKSVTDARSELGFRSDKSFAMSDGIFTLRSRVAWAHDYDPNRSIGATFQTLPGASFVVNGAMQAADSALVTASAEKKWLNGWSAAATFEGEFSNVTSSYGGKGVVRYGW